MKKILLVMLMLVVGLGIYAEEGKKEKVLILIEDGMSKENIKTISQISKDLDYTQRYEIYNETMITKKEMKKEIILNILPGFGIGTLIEGKAGGIVLTVNDTVLLYSICNIGRGSTENKRNAANLLIISGGTKILFTGFMHINNINYNEKLRKTLNLNTEDIAIIPELNTENNSYGVRLSYNY